jgi:ectoine hydroxylase
MEVSNGVAAAPTEPMMTEQRARFDRDGYLIIRGAPGPDEVAAARDALDRVYATTAKAGSLGPDGSMHLLSAVTNCPEVVGLIDHPATFPYVWSVLGWNIHVYHSHLGNGDHAWGHYPEATPLYGWLKERGSLIRRIRP